VTHSDIGVEVRGVSKRYVIGGSVAGTDGLRHVLERALRAPLRWLGGDRSARRSRTSEFWALRDVSFQVGQGEVLGIIGRNGAGKSTLLKLLSRITEPTTGLIRTRGRVASLLEIGTGFHPDLTGRENIFLNGAILGMTRREIRQKFDEIVAFAEVEPFLDLPVKRYSSGMHVRLAFAVAAHLEPDVLIVDEVLAVGDAQFQKKCIGKMERVSTTEGRTVLFVSHQMAVIQHLCSRCLLLDEGRLVKSGAPHDVVRAYLQSAATLTERRVGERTDRRGRGNVRVEAVELIDRDGVPVSDAVSGMEVTLKVSFTVREQMSLRNCRVSAVVFREMQPYFSLSTDLVDTRPLELHGRGSIEFRVPAWPRSGVTYQVNTFVASDGIVEDWVVDAAAITVVDGDFFGTGRLYHDGWQGKAVLVPHSWQMRRVAEDMTGAVVAAEAC
jgi:lipopolysaccharide transport system ATP-binding protein